MKTEAEQILGKTIVGIRTTGGLWPNSSFKHVYDYMKNSLEIVYHTVKDPDSGNEHKN